MTNVEIPLTTSISIGRPMSYSPLLPPKSTKKVRLSNSSPYYHARTDPGILSSVGHTYIHTHHFIKATP